jgi:hypothetical protein
LLFSPGTNRIRFSARETRRQFFQKRAARRSGEMAALHGTVRNCNVPCIEGPLPLDWRLQEVERLRGCGPEPCPPCPPRRTHRRAACPTHLDSFQPSAGGGGRIVFCQCRQETLDLGAHKRRESCKCGPGEGGKSPTFVAAGRWRSASFEMSAPSARIEGRCFFGSVVEAMPPAICERSV